ncbi:xanthine dehydrogenase family protein molybdopterin-binding subunit [Neoaquamicrobium sediminum]|uniref:xanthine dehydrogenase family protein molybdopterin-binding subunit n=1 Tax=Neoaquamicrobium sediminum TaxID=1849104 RepID=UPI0015659C4E|nr:xanthine dehydrogenase family protein molybdopterin-binding subunit [Mesorhizobium sediminum]NRC57213.1 xanthine dehydrogenase family protein molybdopterin-binding subunit [Mesorhizobium sediminum]
MGLHERDLQTVNKRLPLKDAHEKVTGVHEFPYDFTVPGMLYGRILRSPHAHAQIRRIDVSKAEALPGVIAVITHKDVPAEEWIGLWTNYRGCVMDDKVRFVGDEVAAVAAIDIRTADRALELIKVEYDILPHVLDAREAMKPGAPQVKTSGNNSKDVVLVKWGDVEQGFREADVVVEGATLNNAQDQATFSRNSPIASWADNDTKLTLWSGCTAPSELKDAVANLVKLPKSSVRIVALPTGPSLGKWWFNNLEMMTVYLAKKAHRPVKIVLRQDEVFAGIKRRHIEYTTGRLGVMKDGTMVSMEVNDIFDNGAYGDKNDIFQSLSELWPRVNHGYFEMYGVSTNLVTAGCMRGVGDLTMNFALEVLIHKAAEKIDMDPVELRRINAAKAGDPCRGQDIHHELFGSHLPYPEKVVISSCAMDECLTKGVEEFGWKRRWGGWSSTNKSSGPVKRGVGMATAMHVCGIRYTGDCGAIVKVNADGSANLMVSLGRQGNGNDSTQCQIAAEELGIPYDMISIDCNDTNVTPWGQGSTASTSTYLSGTATREAARDAKRKILKLAESKLDESADNLDIKDGVIFSKTHHNKRIPITRVLEDKIPDFWELAKQPCIVGSTVTNVPDDQIPKHVAAHFVELEVDTDTGEIRLLDYLQVQDSGRLINPEVCENQLNGGYYQGVGFTLIEELVHDDMGRILNPNFAHYKIFRCGDLPDPKIHFIEQDDPVGPFGAKGLGEAPICVPPGAIALAIYNATGVWMTETPFTPERVLKALGKI